MTRHKAVGFAAHAVLIVWMTEVITTHPYWWTTIVSLVLLAAMAYAFGRDIHRRDAGHNRSPFAAALAGLLDDTACFTRAEWARFLGVSTSDLSQWVNDETVPRADLLRMMVDVLQSSADVPEEPLAAFEQMAARPAREVSPLGGRMTPTVAEYLRTTLAAPSVHGE